MNLFCVTLKVGTGCILSSLRYHQLSIDFIIFCITKKEENVDTIIIDSSHILI